MSGADRPGVLPQEFRAYRGPAVAFPLGGLGTGQVSLAADGSLTQWEIHNQVNHRGDVPDTVFAVRTSSIEPPSNVRRLLRGRASGAPDRPAPLVSDHVPASWPTLPDGWTPVSATAFAAAYPFASVRYEDASLPLRISLRASTPFVPLDPAASSLPLVVFRFSLANPTATRHHGWLAATLLNTVGWDGVTPIRGTECGLLGGQVNRVDAAGDGTRIVLERPGLDPRDPGHGSQVLWTDAPAASLGQTVSATDALRWVDTLKLLGPSQTGAWSDEAVRRAIAGAARTMTAPTGPSPAGRTWVGALAAAFSLDAGETTEITFVHAWWFPNRVVNFDQFGPSEGPASEAWLGNAYAQPYDGASAVVDAWRVRRTELEAASEAWASGWASTSLDDVVVETLTAQPALVRSPSVFVDADGRAFGFEGGLGASTTMWNGDVGGSCPLNCTHVWNYVQALAGLFPSLEATMRATEWEVLQGPDGSIPHRVRLPLDGPQLHGVPIGGPVDPALDGMLGAVLKTYREARITGDREMLARYWPHMVRLVEHVTERWEAPDGLLRGPQPVTFDIALTGPNMFVGSLWLATLRTMERVAETLGDARAGDYRRRFVRASTAYDDALWNGEYYGQPSDGAAHDYGDGCLSDQLVGQWWAHLLDLGPLLRRERVRASLESIVRFNLRPDFAGVEHGSRVFADDGDGGLVICSWPRGGRPAIPVRYADEVWSGSEYAVAALCLFEGLDDGAHAILSAARRRQSGERRNPFNEIEAGDHYVRAMSGWSLLHASTGWSHDALTGVLRVSSRPGSYPFVTGSAWGSVSCDGRVLEVRVAWGVLELASVQVDGDGRRARVSIGEGEYADDDGPWRVAAGGRLRIDCGVGGRAVTE